MYNYTYISHLLIEFQIDFKLNLDRLLPAIGIGNSHASLSTQFMSVGSPVFTKTVEF